MSTPGRPAQDLNWLITNFVERVPDVAHAVVVSSDGLPLAFSAGTATLKKGATFEHLFAEADADLLRRKAARPDSSLPGPRDAAPARRSLLPPNDGACPA